MENENEIIAGIFLPVKDKFETICIISLVFESHFEPAE